MDRLSSSGPGYEARFGDLAGISIRDLLLSSFYINLLISRDLSVQGRIGYLVGFSERSFLPSRLYIKCLVSSDLGPGTDSETWLASLEETMCFQSSM
jgi:hypothetical protein